MNYKHGMKQSRLYRIWCHVKSRCLNQNNKFYSEYGGRGITVCDDWFDFNTFHIWAVSSGYSDNLSIERLDVNKGYSPDNCKWIPRVEQARNKRKPKNNKTGAVGVTVDENRYRAGYYDQDGKYTSKSFSINKYGKGAAFNMAKIWRNKAIVSLKSFNIHYGEGHLTWE